MFSWFTWRNNKGTCCGHLWVWHMFCGQSLWWTIRLHIFHLSCWDTLWIPNDHMDLCQTHCKQVPDFSRAQGHVVRFGPIGSFQFPPTDQHGLCFGCCFSGPLPLRSLTNGPLFRVRFGESLVVRLYSEIGFACLLVYITSISRTTWTWVCSLHLSIEAQCDHLFYKWVTSLAHDNILYPRPYQLSNGNNMGKLCYGPRWRYPFWAVLKIQYSTV